MRLSYSRSRPQGRSSRRFSPERQRRPEPQRDGRDADPARGQQVDQDRHDGRAECRAAGIGSRRQRGRPAARRPASSRPGSASGDTGPLEQVHHPEQDHHDPARAGRGDQPGVRRGGAIVVVIRDRVAVGRPAVGSAVGPERDAVIGTGRRSRGGPSRFAEAQDQRQRPATRKAPNPRGRPDLEEQVVRVEDLLARLGQLVSEVGAPEVARARRPTRTARSTGSLGCPVPPVIDAPGPLPVFPPIAQRLGRLGEHLAVEPAGGQARGDQGRDDHQSAPAPAHEQQPASRPAAATARPGRPRRRAARSRRSGSWSGAGRRAGSGSPARPASRARPSRPGRIAIAPGCTTQTASTSTSGPTRKPASELASAKVDQGSFEASRRFSNRACAGVPGTMPSRSAGPPAGLRAIGRRGAAAARRRPGRARRPRRRPRSRPARRPAPPTRPGSGAGCGPGDRRGRAPIHSQARLIAGRRSSGVRRR